MTLQFQPYPLLKQPEPSNAQQQQQQFQNLNGAIQGFASSLNQNRQQNMENTIRQAQADREQQLFAMKMKNEEDMHNAFMDMSPNHSLGMTDSGMQGGASGTAGQSMGGMPPSGSPMGGTPAGGTPWGGNVGPSMSDSPSMSMGSAQGTYPMTPQPSSSMTMQQPQPQQSQPPQQTDMVAHYQSMFPNGKQPSMFANKKFMNPTNPAEFSLYQQANKMEQDQQMHEAEMGLKNAQASYFSKRDPEADLKLKTGEKEDQFNQKEWDKIVKDSDPLTATSRSGLGMASKADYNANRALMTLSKPTVTNQEAANVMADIAQIYQGGSATQYGMSHQGYNTLYGNVQSAIQAITGNPQDALPDAIKQRLTGVLQDMKTTNKAVIKQQLDHIERAQPKVISKFSNEWQGIRQNLEGGISGGPDQGSSSNQQFAPDVMAYAQKHGITPQQAQQIKMQRTGGQ